MILQFEVGGEFKERFTSVTRSACRIYEEMTKSYEKEDMSCGAIQAPDIMLEELQ